MERPPFNIEQNIFKAPHSPIRATTLALSALTPKILDEFLDTIDDGMIGMAPAYGPDSILSVVAFASTSRVLLVHMPKAKAKGKSTGEQGRALLKGLLISPSRSKFAFQMDVLAASLHLDLDLRIHGGVDLLSMSLTNDRYSLQARMNSMGGEVKLQKANVYSLFRAEENMRKSSLEDVALQAWVAWRAGTLDNLKITPLLDQAPRINTTALNKRRLSVFAQMIRVTRCLDALKPTSMRNEIADSYSIKKGQLEVTCTRFKNRIRAKGEHIEIEAHHLGQRQTFSASSGRVDGRAVTINLKSSSLPPGPIKVTSIGKEALTGAEGPAGPHNLASLTRDDSHRRPAFLPGDLVT
ncbi:hypothetical protein C8R46DRAFT_395962 [Mycena filopes]|nr:hypothetical protein C8R46DRAFT_395962 [Mycena filopes]